MTELQDFILDHLDQANQKTQAIIDTGATRVNFKRQVYYRLEQSLAHFINNPNRRSKLTIVTGLRGVGKTTLLAQLYQHPSLKTKTKFYLSLDETHLAGITVLDIKTAVEHQLKSRIVNATKPIFLFLDEVHFLPKWSTAVKVLHDNSRQLFLICTGSSAIRFWTNPDIGRRAEMISLPPLSFSEFYTIENIYHQSSNQTVKPQQVEDIQDQAIDLQRILFQSKSAQAVFKALQTKELALNQTTIQADQMSIYQPGRLVLTQVPTTINSYINFYGSLPYTAIIKNDNLYYQHKKTASDSNNQSTISTIEKAIKNRIIQTFNSLILKDLGALDNFNSNTRDKFLLLLLLLANADVINLKKLAKDLGLNVATVQRMLRVLHYAEVIIPIAPAGASFGKIARAYKYCFNSPDLRLALLPIDLNSGLGVDLNQTGRIRGALLEDVVAMYLQRLFINQPISGKLEYDAADGGADFIVMPRGLKSEAVVVEVGYNKSQPNQAIKTLRRFKNRYGLIITDKNLRLDSNNNVVFVPLSTFLML